jgi:histidinol-phosphate phosphatase family protein
MCLLPGVAEGLRRLACSGYQLVVISNQPGVALGRFGESALANVHQRLQELFAACGVALSAFYYCPHHPQGQVAAYASTCRCRKPQPGLLLQAARALDIDLARSWMIGDILDDVEAGRRAGCRTVLINNGNETQWRWSPWRIPDAMTADFASASLAACTAARPHAARLAAEG